MATQSIVDINSRVKEFDYFEFSVLSFSAGILIIAGSDDFIYYRRLEIYFHDVFAVVGNFEWIVDYGRICLSIVEGDEAFGINGKYKVEVGNVIYRFSGEDGLDTYIIAREIDYLERLVKYY